MRIILNGQQAFGKAALEKILEAGKDEIVGVFTAPDKEGRPADPVKQAALEHGLPLFQPSNYKDEDNLEMLRSLNADLMVMAYVIIFIPEAARDIPMMGSIWGATKTGFSWLYPTDGLDEGDILLQREMDIGPDETLGDVYFKKIFPAGVDSVLDVIEAFRAGDPPRSTQDESKATYESWCRKADVQLDWDRQVADVYNRRFCEVGAVRNVEPLELRTLPGDSCYGSVRNVLALSNDER